MASHEDEEEKMCRICRFGEDDGPLVLPCACRGSAKWIHTACLEEWRRKGSREDAADCCGQCKDEYGELISGPMSDEDLLSDLPLELQVHIADAVGERCDRAALALASPRLLGLAACRGLQSYQGLEMSLAFHHVLGGAIDEQVLRRYASRAEATLEGCGWLTGVAAAAGLRTLRLTGSDPGPGPGSVREQQRVVPHAGYSWYLMQPDSTRGALLRIGDGVPLKTIHYEGAEGAERRVRTVWGNGTVTFYEGEKGMERFVRGEHPRGDVFYLEGEKGVEHKVRWEQPCGDVSHYEGEMNAERLVRYELYKGDGAWLVFYYEGEKGTERVVRTGLPFGMSILCHGEQGTAQPKVLVVAALLAAISEVILYLCWQILAHFCWLVLLYATGLRSV